MQQRGDLRNLLLQQIWRKLQNDNNNATGSTFEEFRSPGTFLFFSTSRWQKCRSMSHYDTLNLSTTTHLLLFSWPFSLCRTPPVFPSFTFLLALPFLPPPPQVFPSFTLLLAFIFIPDSSSLSIYYSSPCPYFCPRLP